MERYLDYKPSGVEWIGEVPSHWDVRRVKTLFEIVKIISGELGYEVLSVTQKGIRVKDLNSNEGQHSMDYSKYQIVRPGQFVMNHMDLLTGFVDLSKYVGVTSPDYRVFESKGNTFDGFYLYIFQMCYWGRVFYGLGQGVSTMGRWRLPSDEFLNFLLPFPPLPEQEEIVRYLDTKTKEIDQLVSITQKKIDLLKEKRSSTINEVVTKGLNPNVERKDSGIEWIGEIPSHWMLSGLGFHTVKIGSGSTPRGGSEVYVEKGIPFIRSQNVHFDGLKLEDVSFIDQEIHESMSGSKVWDGDVLLNITGGSIGRCCVVNDIDWEMNVNQHVSIIRTKSTLDNRYLNFLLSSDLGQTQVFYNVTGGNRDGLTIEGIRSFKVTLPPLPEQEEIVRYLDTKTQEIDQLVSIEEKRIETLKEYRQSSISDVVTGKVRVTKNYQYKLENV